MADSKEQTALPGKARLMESGKGAAPALEDMPGIDAGRATRLRRVGIRNVDDLWAQAGDRKGRQEVAALTGIDKSLLATWARRADLMQIRDIRPRQAALLELAGVTSLKQLRRREAASLHQSLADANRTHKLVEEIPGVVTLEGWIVEADRVAG